MNKNIVAIAALLGVMGLSQAAPSASGLVGKKAPMFTAQAVKVEADRLYHKFPHIKEFTFDLKDYIGQLLVLYFYPMDNTPGCTKQAKKFRDDIKRLKDVGITVIGISCDSIKSHKKFQAKHKLPFALVSDSRWKRSISKAYLTAGFLYSKRKMFLIDTTGTVVKAFDKVDIQHQIDNILKVFNK